MLNVLKKAGFQRNPKKCNLEPRQEFQYLGLAWNTKNLRVFLPEDKRNDFRVLGLQILRNPNIALAQRFLGKAIFAWRAVRLGRLHIGPFQMSVIKALKSQRLILDGEAERAIRWWTRTPEAGVELRTPPTTLSMTTDASASGWGATLDHRSASGKWTVKEAELHINHLELLAVMKAVQAFVLRLRNKGVTVHLDNVTAASYFLKEGGTRSARLNEPTRDILSYCSRHRVILVPAFLPGIANLGADALSRGMQTCGDEEDVPAPRHTGGRFFCLQQVSPGQEVLHSGQERQQGSGSQCSLDPAIRSDVRISSPSAYSPDINQDEDVQGISNLSHTTLIQGKSAAGANPVVDPAATTTTSGTVDSTRPEHRQRPAFPGEAQADSLVHLRESFQGQGADQTLAEFICGSWRGSMGKQYSYAWGTWSDWCAGCSVSRTEPSVGQFAIFLWFLYRDRHMAWSSIRTHRAAVATIIDPLTQNPLSQHPMISRFMKAVYLARPPKGKVKPIWSVSEVLEELRSWGLAEA